MQFFIDMKPLRFAYRMYEYSLATFAQFFLPSTLDMNMRNVQIFSRRFACHTHSRAGPAFGLQHLLRHGVFHRSGDAPVCARSPGICLATRRLGVELAGYVRCSPHLFEKMGSVG